MPKVNVDYSNTIIYKIACKDQTIKDIYVGHTTNFTQRKYAHKTNCINEKSTNYKLKVYEFIRNNGGWENWEMIEICSINCKNKLDALKWEHEYYYLLNATLNNVQPFSYKNNEKEINNRGQTISSQGITSEKELRNEIILENNNIINNIVLNNESIVKKNDLLLKKNTLLTEKILSNLMEQNNKNAIESVKKTKFKCDSCKYYTNILNDFKKHESTTKHMNMIANKTNVIELANTEIVCNNCNRSFKCRLTLGRHHKKCTETLSEKKTNGISEELIMELIKENKELKDLLKEQSTELKDTLKDALKEQSKALIEISTKSNTTLIQNNTTTNNTTNNNSFNLNLFLNEQCKDAISITDFVDSLNLNVGDLEATGKLGYVLGISRIFINKLKELDVYERPLHCTDYKRETVYIKNQDTWEKDNSEKSKLRTIVSRIARKNLEQLPAWQAENPDYVRSDTPENNEYMKISLSSLGGYSNEEENKHVEKIMRNVLKEVTVDKNALTDS
jgi:hypothetical protein